MERIKVKIVGISPLLMNKFTDEAQMKATKGTGSSQVGTRPSPEEDAESRLYYDEGGNIIMPQPNIYNCLINAGKFHKHGKSKVTTLRTSLIPAGIFMNEMYYKLESEGGWSVDARPIRNPVTGGRIIRYRPVFYDWSVSFELEVDTEMFSIDMARQFMDDAGKKIGLCDFRPDCRGPFGRFRVDKWERVK